MLQVRMLSHWFFRSISLVCLFSLLGAHCKQVDEPKEDATPPVIHWGMPDREFSISGQTVPIKTGQNILLVVTSTDEQSGIAYTKLTSQGEYSCKSGGLGSVTPISAYTIGENTYSISADGKWQVDRVYQDAVNLGTRPCQAGFNLASGTLTYTATARNSKNGETVSNITFILGD